MPELSRRDSVFVADFGADENRTTHTWCDSMEAILDEVEAAPAPAALVTTGQGKFYCSGLDTDYMKAEPDDVPAYVARVARIIGRLFAAPLPSVAAVNGHAFGMGAFLTIAQDRAVMREDRGFVCWPEIQLGMAFPRPLVELNRARLSNRTMHEAMITGHRFSATEAVAHGFVEEAVPEDQLIERAVALATVQAPLAGKLFGKIKRQMHRPIIEGLLEFGR